jgi:hypothetical protein
MTADGTATDAGRAARDGIEVATDALCRPLVEAVEPAAFDRALRMAVGLAATVAEAGVIPYPNPTGVPAVTTTPSVPAPPSGS